MLLADFEVKVVVSAVASAWVSRFTNNLSGVLESGVGCAHMSIQNEPVAAMLDNTLWTRSHGVTATIVSARGDPSRADGRNVISP